MAGKQLSVGDLVLTQFVIYVPGVVSEVFDERCVVTLCPSSMSEVGGMRMPVEGEQQVRERWEVDAVKA